MSSMQQNNRLRLRPWLEEQINSGKYPGVTWLDQPAQVFQIPWKHAARHGWSIDQDATLFRSWAIHTGRYQPDRDPAHPKTWKANFRCALNSLPDVCELREQSCKRGRDAHRVYKLLPSSTHTNRRRRGQRGSSESRQIQMHCDAGGNTHSTLTHSTPCVKVETEQPLQHAHPQGQWEATPEDREQTEAVFKLMDHLSSSELWNQTAAWRTHCADEHCLCTLHSDSYPHWTANMDWSILQ